MVLGSGLYLWGAFPPYNWPTVFNNLMLCPVIRAPRAPRHCPRLLSVASADDNEKDKRNG